MYIDQLASVWMEDSTAEATQASIDRKIDSFVEGDLEHATEFLSALWEIGNKDGDTDAPPNTSPVVSPFRSWPLPGIAQECSLLIIGPPRSRAPPTGPL